MTSPSYLSGSELDSAAHERDYRPTEIRTWLRLGMNLLMLTVGTVAAMISLDFVPLARYFAMFAAAGVAVIAGLNTIVDLWGTVKGLRAHQRGGGPSENGIDQASDNAAAGAALGYFSALVGCVVAVAVFGVPVGGGLFLLVFLRFGARWRWRRAILGAVAILVGTLVFGHLLDMQWPDSLLSLEELVL